MDDSRSQGDPRPRRPRHKHCETWRSGSVSFAPKMTQGVGSKVFFLIVDTKGRGGAWRAQTLHWKSALNNDSCSSSEGKLWCCHLRQEASLLQTCTSRVSCLNVFQSVQCDTVNFRCGKEIWRSLNASVRNANIVQFVSHGAHGAHAVAPPGGVTRPSPCAASVAPPSCSPASRPVDHTRNSVTFNVNFETFPSSQTSHRFCFSTKWANWRQNVRGNVNFVHTHPDQNRPAH